MNPAYYLNLFLEEGRERLQQLGELLVALERTPQDRALLADVFRVVHTFKGMADTMDFPDLVTLTHAMEGVFDGLRQGRLELDAPLTHQFLRCLDALEARLDAIEDTPTAAPVDFGALEAELTLVLARVRPSEPEPELVLNVARVNPAASEASRLFRIDITLDASCYMKSARALVITSSLELLGSVVDVTPSLEELEWENAGECFSVLLLADTTPAEIAGMITGLSEIADTRITEQAAAVASDPPPFEGAEREALERAIAEGRQALWIEILFGPLTSQRASRASRAVEQLGEYGQVLRVEPPLSELEREGVYAFRALVTTTEDPTTLRESLLAIREILTVGIQPHAHSRRPEPVLPPRPARRTRSLRVEAERLDGLMDQLGALAIGQNRLQRVLERQGLAQRAEVREAVEDLQAMTVRLREAMMGLRLVPLETVFNRYPRVVRDLAGELGKQVSFVTVGGELPLDRLLVDELGELLVHLIRNALDHGLETPAERHATGKPSTSTLTLEARLEGAQVLIRVSDDGRGVDVERVAELALARGLLSEAERKAWPRERVLELIFRPGFSTTERATRLSGRGVGLDAVKHRVDGLGGFVHVETQPGRGTAFELRFPLPRDFLARASEPLVPREP